MVIFALHLFLFWLGWVQGQQLKNVMFIMLDDMRPELGSYVGSNEAFYPDILTPNIDTLAEESVVLLNAYTNYPVCAPSRSSLLTGRRPDTNKVYDLITYWRESGGNFTTMPQYFKENGYISLGAGKIFHRGDASGGNNDGDYSWSEDFYDPETRNYWGSRNSTWRIATEEEIEEIPLPDQLATDYIITKLNEVADGAISGETPFFMAAGFLKPHLPFTAPQSFYDLYPEDNVYLPEYKYTANEFPDVAWYKMIEIGNYDNINDTTAFNDTLPDNDVLAMRRGYYATVSFVDSLVGEIVSSLNALSLINNTIIIISSDHGYNLGEHAMWNKHNNGELSLKVPLMIKIPGLTDQIKFNELNALVENIDLFPTIVEASGLPLIPECPLDSSDILVCHEGLSMMNLITGDVPETEWKDAIFSQYFKFEDIVYTEVMGYSIREENYHYTKWVHFENNTVDWDFTYGVELYDLINDPNEDNNVADDPSYADEVDRLDVRLRIGWRGALPYHG